MTPLSLKVYKVVSDIPFGQVRTYKWVAKKAGRPKAFRAVGQILKRNPYPLIIPCHRVICSGGDTGGYVFGRRKKSILLELERKISRLMI